MYEGVDISIRYLADLFATQGPFLGVMAFSHGACNQSFYFYYYF